MKHNVTMMIMQIHRLLIQRIFAIRISMAKKFDDEK